MFKNLRFAPKSGGLKYHVTVHVHSFTLAKGGPPLPPNCEELSLLWNRGGATSWLVLVYISLLNISSLAGAKLASTKGISISSLKDGVLVFDERLILICTFYRGKASGFEEKKAKFVLKGGPLGSCDSGTWIDPQNRYLRDGFTAQYMSTQVEGSTYQGQRSTSASTHSLTK